MQPSIFILLPSESSEGGTLYAGYGSLVAAGAPPPGVGAFYAPDFFLNAERPWFIPERFEIAHVVARDERRTLARTPLFAPLDRGSVKEEVAAVVERIVRHEFKKVVPVWFERSGWVPSTEEREALYVNALSNGIAGRFPYGFISAEEGVIGVSPEILFRVGRDGMLHTMALAGTQRLGSGGSVDDLLTDPKERGEHTFVIDYIDEALSHLGVVTIGETTVREYPGLRHLYTPISLRPKTPPRFEELVTRLHPTPALGALPREEGLRWLRDRERIVPRARHGAPFGVILPSGEMLCLVGIRNIQWGPGGSRIGAGCGIVEGSIPERECGEAAAKIGAVKSMLGIPS